LFADQSSVPALSPPDQFAKKVRRDILTERVSSSRGRVNERGQKRKSSKFAPKKELPGRTIREEYSLKICKGYIRKKRQTKANCQKAQSDESRIHLEKCAKKAVPEIVLA
jgi:hypothetical protein